MSSWTMQRRLKSLAARQRGGLVALHVVERGRELSALCPDDEVFTLTRELILDRIYDREGTSFFDGMGTVVDAGAHAGLFTLQASQWARRVVSIEASRVNYDLLTLNIDRNGLGNVEPRHLALWSTSNEALQLEAMHNTGGGRVVDSSSPAGTGTAVASLSLDDLIEEVGEIDLLKMDIEGSEFATVGACTKLGAISRIVGEMHIEHPDDRARLDALVGQLEDSGFCVSLVAERDLYSHQSLARLLRNRSALHGYTMAKVLAAAYYVAPIEKPIRPALATYELPVLVAHQRS